MSETKTFAFKLAKKAEEKATPKWKVRDGVSEAFCTSGSLGTYFKISGTDKGNPC